MVRGLLVAAIPLPMTIVTSARFAVYPRHVIGDRTFGWKALHYDPDTVNPLDATKPILSPAPAISSD